MGTRRHKKQAPSIPPFAEVSSTRQLLQLQRTFAAIIRRRLNQRDGMRRDERVRGMIRPSAQLTAHQRIELYAQQYWWRIRDSLAEDFPVTRGFLGQSQYQKLAEDYLFRYPSISFTLRNLGSRFPQFLKRLSVAPLKRRNRVAGKFRIASEIALLEWTLIELFDSVSVKQVPQLSPTSRVTLSSSLRILKLSYPAHHYFRSYRDQQRDEQVSNAVSRRTARSVRSSKDSRRSRTVPAQTTYLAVHRQEGRSFFKELSQSEFQLLKLIQDTGSIARALRRWRYASSKEGPQLLQRLFTEWGSLGWIVPRNSVRA